MENNSYNNNYSGVKRPTEGESGSLNFREIVDFLWRLRWWEVMFAAIALTIAFVYVRLQTPVYQSTCTVMLNRNDAGSTETSLLSQFSGRMINKRIDNEVFLLTSPRTMKGVLDELEINKRYFHYVLPIGNSRITVQPFRSLLSRKLTEYYNDSPFTFHIEQNGLLPSDMQVSNVYIRFKDAGGGHFTVTGLNVDGHTYKVEGKHKYGEFFDAGSSRVKIDVPFLVEMVKGDTYICSWTSSSKLARSFAKSVNANIAVGNYNNLKMSTEVVTLTMVDAQPTRARDILNTLVEVNNRDAQKYANSISLNTINFIDQRLETIASDLDVTESGISQYSSQNSLANIDSQTQLTMTSDLQYRNQLDEVRLQLKVLAMISDYLEEDGDEFKIIPTNIGVSDAGLNSTIVAYNTLVAERNRMIASSSENNPRVRSINSQLVDGKKGIELSIANLVKVYSIRERELSKTVSSSQRKIADIPQQHYELQRMSRKLEVIEPLYLLLQQKREEAQISMYSQVETFRIVDEATSSTVPISPRKNIIYLVALLIGLALPAGMVIIRTQLKYRVETKMDLTDAIDATVMAVLPLSQIDKLIQKHGRDPLTESFSMLRSNLQYIPSNKVIQVVSSIPGEGKSFVSVNLAISLANASKKVLLVGMDLRKPVLRKVFDKVRFANGKNVISYLTGIIQLGPDMVTPSGVSDYLDLLPAGPIPPNPTELLTTGKHEALVEYFRDYYDFILIDSAPLFPVSDSLLINKCVDVTLYVSRADYTPLKLLPEIQETIHNPNAPLKNVYLILNGINYTSSKYEYGYGQGYGYGYGGKHYGYTKKGYGYGHGYGYGYGEDPAEGKDGKPIKRKRLSRKEREELAKNDPFKR